MKCDPKCLLLFTVALLLFLTPPIAAAPPAQSAVKGDSVEQAQLAIDRLQQTPPSQKGLWKTTGWWNAANALTAIIDFSRATNSSQYQPVIARTYIANAQGRFLNEFYDDEGWWALAWIDAYDLTGETTYLRTAGAIFDDMTGGWDNTCGGGIWWKKDRTYKNAIANELFLSVAAHLANRAADRSRRARYAAWAKREWQWFQHTGMIGPDNLISDGLDAKCQNNHETEWSYNQGVILGGLTELSYRHRQSGVLREAGRIADAVVEKLVDSNGVLHDPCEPECGADGTQFKGIFVRNLVSLTSRIPSVRYIEFITVNAESLLKQVQGSDYSFGTVWSGPPEAPTAASQSSAIDALVAVLSVRKAKSSSWSVKRE
jgi:predicted alpha-1,6-mannanase (GH76 family)